LDLLKMQWGVEKMPSDPLDPTYPQSAYYRITDNNLTSYSTGATDPNVDPDGLLWDMLPDGTPTSTHTYNGVWYDSTRRQLGTSRISKWTYDLATKTWSRQRWTRNGGSPTTFSIYANLFYHAGNDALYGFFDGEYSAYRFGKVAFPGSDEVSISSPGWIGVTVTACRLDEDRALFFFYNGTTTKVEYAAIFNMATETWYKWGGSAWVPNAGATIAVPVTNGVPFDTTFQGAGQMALFIPSWGAQGQVLRTQESATPTEWWIYDIATHTNFSYTPNGAILDQVRVYLPFSKWVSFPTLGLAVGIQTYPRSSSTNNAVYVMRYE
jgi:hypothetical protein